MNTAAKPPFILVANNPFGHHLLTSQLLDLYAQLAIDRPVILLCNGIVKGADVADFPWLTVISYATKAGGLVSHLNLARKFAQMRLKQPDAIYHIRGFVSGVIFCVSRLFALSSVEYIYDPRGAFFIEWREAGRSKLLSRIFGWFEHRLIRNADTTIVTSRRFERLYRHLFGRNNRYCVIYNATSFPYSGTRGLPESDAPIRLVYLGTFNEWHDMHEVSRVMQSASDQLGPERTEIYIYTSDRFHDAARQVFGAIPCAKLHIGYVNYHDIPATLGDKHIGVSVVRPTLSTSIASPIKVSDYVALGLVPLLNKGIGDFDAHFVANQSAILYPFGGEVDLSGLTVTKTEPNEDIFHVISRVSSLKRLRPTIDRLLSR